MKTGQSSIYRFIILNSTIWIKIWLFSTIRAYEDVLLNESAKAWQQKFLFPPFYSFAIIFVDIITFLSLLFQGVVENKSYLSIRLDYWHT